MNELEARVNAMLQEVQAQRDIFGLRAANLAADLATAKLRIAELEAMKENPEAQPELKVVP